MSCFQVDFYTQVLRFYFPLFSQMSAVIVQERKFCCIWFRFALRSQLTHFCIFNFLASIRHNISCICISFTHQVEVFLLIVLSIVALLFIRLEINNIMKPDLVFVVTAHMVYFCAFAHSAIFQKTPGN